jgi:luciferase-type oxidoreductase
MDGTQDSSTNQNSIRFGRHRGYQRLFVGNHMTIGIELPLEADWTASGEAQRIAQGRPSGVPSMTEHATLAELADQLGFAGLWLRDVPLYDPVFGDAGQVFDPFVYLGYLSAITHNITLATAAIILPLRHPLQVTKAAASIDQLSNGRLVLGIATGDRPIEFPVFGVDFGTRGQILRDAVETLTTVWCGSGIPTTEGLLSGVQILPKPVVQQIPLLMAGRGQQTLKWIAQHLDGWINYPQDLDTTAAVISEWRQLVSALGVERKPFITTFLVDLHENPNAPMKPFRFGATLGRNRLANHLESLAAIGVDHLALNFRRSYRPINEVMQEISEYILPLFPSPITSSSRMQCLA